MTAKTLSTQSKLGAPGRLFVRLVVVPLLGRQADDLHAADRFFNETALTQQRLQHLVRVVVGLVVVVIVLVAPARPSARARVARRRPGRVGFRPGKMGGAVTPGLEPGQPQVLFDLGHQMLDVQRQQLGLLDGGGRRRCGRHHVPAGHRVAHICARETPPERLSRVR